MRTFFIILFLLIVAGESVSAENSDKTIIQTPLTEQNLSPDALFDQIRGFLTLPIPIFNRLAPVLKMPDFDASGVQNLRSKIQQITGVDVFQFFSFLWNIFIIIVRYLLELLPRTVG